MNQVDLSALRMQATPAARPRRPLGPRLLGFATAALALTVGASFLWPLLWPARAVEMAPVRAVEAAGATGEGGGAVAEAVGWVEADPFAVAVRPLVEGRIESLEVLEGASVKAGVTVLARLASAPLQAAAERAAVRVSEAERALAVAATARELAAARLAQRAELRAAALEATSALAELDARVAAARSAVLRTTADHRAAMAAHAAQQRLQEAGTSNPVALERTSQAERAADAARSGAEAELPNLERQRGTAAELVRLREELLAAPIDLQFALRTAEAEFARAEAMLASARAEQTIAARELQWTAVTAPVDGVVLRLLAAPGSSTGPDGDGILQLYDPAHLRARIDVPLGTVANVAPGQPVELRSEVTGATVVRGVVQRLQHESDLLKNTLQVKVQLLDPPALWRPETLCRAIFLGTKTAGNAPGKAAPSAFLVPQQAVRDGRVFVFEPGTGTARAVAVTVLRAADPDAVVQGELSPTQRVVVSPVEAGERIQELRR